MKNNTEKLRTDQQSKALHVAFTQLGDSLTEQGLNVYQVLDMIVKKGGAVEMPWNQTLVKELLWRPFQKAVNLEKSTTKLSTTDIDKVFEILHRSLYELFPGITLPPFPSIESMMRDIEQPPFTDFDRDVEDRSREESVPL